MEARLLMSVVLFAFVASAQAGFGASGTDTRQILAEQKRILKEIESPNGKYSRFSDEAQRRLQAAQARIFDLLAAGRSLEELRKDQQMELLNSVEEVKAIISNNEQDKLECWREAKLGTKLRVTRCETVATRARLREESREWKSDTTSCQMGEAGDPFCGAPRD